MGINLLHAYRSYLSTKSVIFRKYKICLSASKFILLIYWNRYCPTTFLLIFNTVTFFLRPLLHSAPPFGWLRNNSSINYNSTLLSAFVLLYSLEGQSFILACMCQGMKTDSHVLESEGLRFKLKEWKNDKCGYSSQLRYFSKKKDSNDLRLCFFFKLNLKNQVLEFLWGKQQSIMIYLLLQLFDSIEWSKTLKTTER